MTRTTTATTTTAAAAAAAAKPVRRPRAGKVRTVKVDPAALATATPAELAAPILPEAIAPAQEPVKAIPAKFAAAAAKVAAAKAAKPAKRQATPRVNVTAHEAANLAAMGWAVPKVDANWEATPEKRQRFNACRNGDAYDILAATIADEAVTLAEIAEFWAGTMGAPQDGKRIAPQALLQQIANRLQRKVRQQGIVVRAF